MLLIDCSLFKIMIPGLCIELEINDLTVVVPCTEVVFNEMNRQSIKKRSTCGKSVAYPS